MRCLFYTHLMPFLIYRDKMRAKGPNHYPYTLGIIAVENIFLHKTWVKSAYFTLWKNDQNYGKLPKIVKKLSKFLKLTINCEKITKILENWPIIFQNYRLNILNDVICDSQHEKCIFSFLFCINLGFHGLAFLQLCFQFLIY